MLATHSQNQTLMADLKWWGQSSRTPNPPPLNPLYQEHSGKYGTEARKAVACLIGSGPEDKNILSPLWIANGHQSMEILGVLWGLVGLPLGIDCLGLYSSTTQRPGCRSTLLVFPASWVLAYWL